MTDFNQKTHDTDVGSHGGQSRQMLQVFENQEFGSIRVLQEAGKTFFCASDIAKALGYVNPYAAVKRHCRGINCSVIPPFLACFIEKNISSASMVGSCSQSAYIRRCV